MNDFTERRTTRKGTLGERIAERWLARRGYHVYRPCDVDNAHPIDRVAIHRTRPALVFDVKAKPRRLKYPDTGINVDHWKEYFFLARTNNMRALIIFVDEDRGEVYGNFLDVLDQARPVNTERGNFCYPRTEHYRIGDEIRYFPLIAMEHFTDLTAEETLELKALSTRAAKYAGPANERARQGSLFR